MYFIKAQQDRNEWWKYVFILLPVGFSFVVLSTLPYLVIIQINKARNIRMDLPSSGETSTLSDLGLDQNVELILQLFPAAITFFVLAFMMNKLLDLKSGRIASAGGSIRWNRLFSAAFLWLLLLGGSELIYAFFYPENYRFQFDPQKFLPLLFIALLIIPLQAWFEELFFRSYLLMGIGLAIGSRIIPVVISSLIFGLIHLSNPEVKQYGLMSTIPFYIGFGLFAGILVVFDDGIEMACGVHAMNNIFAAVLVGYDSSVLRTAALWNTKTVNPGYMMAFLISVAIFILVMSRVYHWKDWYKIFRIESALPITSSPKKM